MNPPSDLRWRKSSFTVPDGNCVEVALLPLGVAIRDSKDTAGPTLAFAASYPVTSFVAKLAHAAPKNTTM